MKKNYNIACLLIMSLFAFSSLTLNAQTHFIKGRVTDGTDNTPIPGATILLVNGSDTTKYIGTTSDNEGYFRFGKVSQAHYKLKISCISYSVHIQKITVANSDMNLPAIRLHQKTMQINEVTVETNQVRVEQKGDTLQYHASAYKINPDATAEDLIKKMPGVTSDGSTVKVNGEEVKKVLVDGKPFFGDDPSATLKNLPADMVDGVQVFDKLSDQAQFTGFKDGDEQKTLNILTKEEKNVGQFGKIYGGSGTDDRLNSGFNYNYFNGNRRISLIGMSNNINQQNFSISDIMSVMSNSGSQGGPPGPGSPMANFFSGQQGGNTITNAVGINYVDNLGEKLTLSGSYFFNQTNNTNTSSSLRNYFNDNNIIYDQNSSSKTDNINHRFNFKVEYAIDSLNSLIFTPRLTFQSNNSRSRTSSIKEFLNSDSIISTTDNNTFAKYTGYDFQNDFLFQHKFIKKRRTLSVNINTQINNRDGHGDYYSSSLFFDTATTGTIINQDYESFSRGITWGGNISYTEPIGGNGQIAVSYRPAWTKNSTDKSTYNITESGEINNLDTALSNKYNSIYNTQKGGVSYRFRNDKINFSAGADIQQSGLEGNQTFPYSSSLKKTYTNILPTLMFNYKFSKTKNLNIMYRTQSKSPSITQLQNVVDISNPLLIKSGNETLVPAYENNLMMRLGFNSPDKTHHFFVFLMANQTNNYISNASYLLNNDTLLNGYTINKGSQITIPVNINNYYNLKSFGVYSLPLSIIKSNLNLNFGYSYSHTPALINNNINYSKNQTINGGIYLSSNISQYFDFLLSYNESYNNVRNTLQTQSNSSYFNHTVTVKINYILFKKIVLNTDVNQIKYSGLTQSYNQNYTLWNAYIGYKFLKDQSLEAKVSIYDLLNQNQSISRTITETYTEDSHTQILKRYMMFTLTYTFKKFKNGSAPNQGPNDFPKDMPPPPANMPPPGDMPPPK